MTTIIEEISHMQVGCKGERKEISLFGKCARAMIYERVKIQGWITVGMAIARKFGGKSVHSVSAFKGYPFIERAEWLQEPMVQIGDMFI